MSVILYSPFHAWMASYFPLFGACIWLTFLFNASKYCNSKYRQPTPLEKAVTALQKDLVAMKANQDQTAWCTNTVLETLRITIDDLPTGDNIQEVFDSVIDETRGAQSKLEMGLRQELKAEVAALKAASKAGALSVAEIKGDLHKMKEEFHKVKASIETTDGATLKEAVYTSLRAQAERLDNISQWAKSGKYVSTVGQPYYWVTLKVPHW